MNDLSKYNAVKQDFRTGDMISWNHHTLIGRLIRWKTGEAVNHSSLVIRLAEYEGLERRRFVTEAVGQGTVLTLLSNTLETYDGEAWWYPLVSEMDLDRQAIGERALSMIGRPYDFGGIIRLIIGSVAADARKLWCSEYVFMALGLSDPDLGVVPYGPNPGQLNRIGVFEEGVKIL